MAQLYHHLGLSDLKTLLLLFFLGGGAGYFLFLKKKTEPITKNSTDVNTNVILTLGIHAHIITVKQAGLLAYSVNFDLLICNMTLWY